MPHTLGNKEIEHSETPSKSLFGLLVGPSGTEKTVAITHLCKKFPRGIMYSEVSNPLAFPETLAAEVGMKLDSFGFVELVLGYISPEYALYQKDPFKH